MYFRLVHDVVLDEDSPTSSKNSDQEIGEERVSQQLNCAVKSYNDYPNSVFSESSR